MNYIQRLFDSAATSAPARSLPVAPPTMASSPVMAADQRLGIFPGLVDPFGLPPAPDAAEGEAAPPRRERQAPTPSRTESPGRTNEPPRDSRHAATRSAEQPQRNPTTQPRDPPRDPHAVPGRAEQPRITPVQRMVERAPLAARPAPAIPKSQTPPDTPPPTLTIPPSTAPETAPSTPTAPSELRPTLPLIRNPAEITPDQFTPRAAENTQIPPPHDILPPKTSLPTEAARTEPRFPEPQPPASLQPAADHGPSPFARQPDLPPAPAAQQTQPEPAKPAPERIIERIREVPITPSTPPKAMTAAAQSVIGPLGQRRFGRWQPRQGGI